MFIYRRDRCRTWCFVTKLMSLQLGGLISGILQHTCRISCLLEFGFRP